MWANPHNGKRRVVMKSFLITLLTEDDVGTHRLDYSTELSNNFQSKQTKKVSCSSSLKKEVWAKGLVTNI